MQCCIPSRHLQRQLSTHAVSKRESNQILTVGGHLRITGTAVLKVNPNTTDIPAARPAVRARSRWDETSPTNAQPS